MKLPNTFLDVALVVLYVSDEWRSPARRLLWLQESARARVLRDWPLRAATQTSARLSKLQLCNVKQGA